MRYFADNSDYRAKTFMDDIQAQAPPRGARGSIRLEHNGHVYWFKTEAEAEIGLKLLRQAEAVQTVLDGSSPAGATGQA